MELIILTGLQGAGKSTFYRTRFGDTHVHVSKDNFRTASNKDRRQQQLIEEALGQGRSVVIDNTNPAPAQRTPLIAQGRSFGATIIGYYFESTLSECLARNSLREGIARVPEVALHIALRNLQRPTYAEGFDSLYGVVTGSDRQFEVQSWDKG